jgi:hypothetical protein
MIVPSPTFERSAVEVNCNSVVTAASRAVIRPRRELRLSPHGTYGSSDNGPVLEKRVREIAAADDKGVEKALRYSAAIIAVHAIACAVTAQRNMSATIVMVRGIHPFNTIRLHIQLLLSLKNRKQISAAQPRMSAVPASKARVACQPNRRKREMPRCRSRAASSFEFATTLAAALVICLPSINVVFMKVFNVRELSSKEAERVN